MLSSTDLVLVCVFPSSGDIEIAPLLGWYRITFYQASASGQCGGRIEFTAPVYGHELATRCELLREEIDYPCAHQGYLNFQVGGLEKLPDPILAKNWKCLTFLDIIGQYLLQAKTLTDLVVNDHDNKMLFKSLRGRAQNSDRYKVDLQHVDFESMLLTAY